MPVVLISDSVNKGAPSLTPVWGGIHEKCFIVNTFVHLTLELKHGINSLSVLVSCNAWEREFASDPFPLSSIYSSHGFSITFYCNTLFIGTT